MEEYVVGMGNDIETDKFNEINLTAIVHENKRGEILSEKYVHIRTLVKGNRKLDETDLSLIRYSILFRMIFFFGQQPTFSKLPNFYFIVF